MPTLLTIGDSHSSDTFRNIHLDMVHIDKRPIGGITMHRVGRDMMSFTDLCAHLVDGDYVLFCFGEIDIRCHVHRQVCVLGHDIDEVTSTLVKNYFKAISTCTQLPTGARPLVLLPVPPCDNQTCKNNPDFPFCGTNEERVLYHSKVIKCMREEAPHHNIGLFDLLDAYTGENGLIIPSLSDGNVHIGDTRHVVPVILSLFNK